MMISRPLGQVRGLVVAPLDPVACAALVCPTSAWTSPSPLTSKSTTWPVTTSLMVTSTTSMCPGSERDISEITGEEGGCGDGAEEIDREVERFLGLEHGSLDLADGGEHVDEAAASAAAAAAEAADDPADLDLGGAEPDAGAAAGDAPPADERADIAPDAAGLDLQALLDRHACSQTEILFPVPEWVITRGGEKIGSVSEVRKPNCDFTTYKATCLMSHTTVVGDKRRRCSCWLRTDRCDHRTTHYTLVEWLVSGHPGADGAADRAATCKAINERYPAPAKPRGRGGKRSAAG